MVESYDEYENGESADINNGTPSTAGTSPRSSTGSPSASSRPRDINVTNGNRAGNVFDSYDLTRRGEDRKIPRQARPTILRKEIVEKKKSFGWRNWTKFCGNWKYEYGISR